MKKESSSRLSPEANERLQQLAQVPDEAIDTSDVPEIRDWKGAKRGLFYAKPTANDQVAVGLQQAFSNGFASMHCRAKTPNSLSIAFSGNT